MAIRRPSWDLSREQIEAAAKGLKFDRDYFARQQPQVRADSAASAKANAEAVEREVTRELIKRMSPAQVDAYIAARSRDPSTDIASFIRADSAGGLKMTQVLDDSGRPIRTFKLEGQASKRSTWMGQFMAEPQEQVMLNRKGIPLDRFDQTEAAWRADRALREQAARDIAAGKPVLVDLSFSCRDFEV